MSILKIVFTLDYEESHNLYIDAFITSHFPNTPCSKIREYQKDYLKAELFMHTDRLFNIEVTNELLFAGEECRSDREVEPSELRATPDYPEAYLEIVWKHHNDERGRRVNEIVKVE